MYISIYNVKDSTKSLVFIYSYVYLFLRETIYRSLKDSRFKKLTLSGFYRSFRKDFICTIVNETAKGVTNPLRRE